MSGPTTIEGWLAVCYQADRRKQVAAAIEKFKTALAASPDMTKEALAEMKRLDELIAARGRRACAYSANYNDYLHMVLDK